MGREKKTVLCFPLNFLSILSHHLLVPTVSVEKAVVNFVVVNPVNDKFSLAVLKFFPCLSSFLMIHLFVTLLHVSYLEFLELPGGAD